MDYQTIKSKLAEAERLVKQDKLLKADQLIRSMIGKGVTPNDIRTNMDAESLKKLNKFAKDKAEEDE